MDRYRWLASALAIVFVAVLGSFGLARGAAALTLPEALHLSPPASEAEEEDEGKGEAEDLGEAEAEAGDDGGEEALDDCEFEDEAREEACEEAEEEREAEEAEAEECRLESAEATVTALPGHNQVRLTVRYRTFEPSAVAIGLALHGARGGLDLGSENAHFGRSGSFHATETLTDPQMTRALAAREFTVALHAINTPGFCADQFERHLSARRSAGAGAQWTDPAAGRRAKASHAKRAGPGR